MPCTSERRTRRICHPPIMPSSTMVPAAPASPYQKRDSRTLNLVMSRPTKRLYPPGRVEPINTAWMDEPPRLIVSVYVPDDVGTVGGQEGRLPAMRNSESSVNNTSLPV